MEWIDINSSKPNDGQLVLVYGTCIKEIGKKPIPNSIGLVEWNNEDKNQFTKDWCYYIIEYTNITHWAKVNEIE